MKKDTNLLEVAVTVIAGVILVPLAWNYILCPVVNGIGIPVIEAVERLKYKRYLKKGLKEGRIIYHDGNHYELPEGMTTEDFVKIVIGDD